MSEPLASQLAALAAQILAIAIAKISGTLLTASGSGVRRPEGRRRRNARSSPRRAGVRADRSGDT